MESRHINDKLNGRIYRLETVNVEKYKQSHPPTNTHQVRPLDNRKCSCLEQRGLVSISHMTENMQNVQFPRQHKILLRQKIHDYFLPLKNPLRVKASFKFRLTMLGQANVPISSSMSLVIFSVFETEIWETEKQGSAYS